MKSANDNEIEFIQVRTLPTGAQSTIRALRFWIVGWRCQDARYLKRAQRELSNRHDEEAANAVACAFACLFEVLRTNADKEFRHCPPCHGYASADEISFVVLIAAAQAGLWRDVSVLAERLVHESAVGDVILKVKAFAAALKNADMFIGADLTNQRTQMKHRHPAITISTSALTAST